MKTKNKWESFRNKIYSTSGKWVGGQDVTVHGFSMMTELLGKVSYMQMIVLNATGRLINQNLASWLEGNFIGMSYPDSRIWCNQVGAICGSLKTSVTAATVAGVLASDSRAYGGSKTSKLGMLFIQNALKQKRDGSSIETIIQNERHKEGKPVITGYARPVMREDERIKPHEKMTMELGFSIGEHLTLAYEITEFIEKKYGLGMNIGGYTSAFLSDQGFSPEEVYRIKSLCVASGVTASYVDNLDVGQDGFLPMHCSDIQYIGPNIRSIE